MGHPLNGIGYLLEHWERLQNTSPYFVFFLFLPEHPFARIFQEQFEHLDQISGEGCMFFAIAPPPAGWEEKARMRDYWKYYLANSEKQVGYDPSAVRQAARYFNVPREHLPAMVLFRDLHHSDSIVIHLGDFQSEQIPAFLHNAFLALNHQDSLRYLKLYQLRGLFDILPSRSRLQPAEISGIIKAYRDSGGMRAENLTFRGERLAAHRLVYHTDYPRSVRSILVNLQQELQRLNAEVSSLRDEQRKEFRQVNARLERIQVVLEETVGRIQEFREPFIVELQTLYEQGLSSSELQDEQEALNQKFDQFLERESNQLAERLVTEIPPSLPSVMDPYQDLLEPETRQSLMTSELLWSQLAQINLPYPIDFSVCGIGLWKSLEIEINRTFVDALRVFNGLSDPGMASFHQSPKKLSRVEAIPMFMDKNGQRIPKPKPVEISKIDDNGVLMGFELGPVGGLIANHAGNDLSKLIAPITLRALADGETHQSFFDDLGERVKYVGRVYRNSHAHIHPMRRDICEQFRNFLFGSSPRSPLLATLECKREFQRAAKI